MSAGVAIVNARLAGAAGRERAIERFSVDALSGEIALDWMPAELERDLAQLLDPGSALRTLHWGRNYLYVAPFCPRDGAAAEVVVKQFRHATARARLQRRLRGSKAERSFRAAERLLEIGVPTPEPVLYADSVELGGPSWFVCLYRGDLLEARYLLRALAAGTAERDHPELDLGRLLRGFGALARRLHEGGVWHRDISAGNILVDPEFFAKDDDTARDPVAGLYLVDLNRARLGRRLTFSERVRDLARLPLPRSEHRALFVGGYLAPDAAPGSEPPRLGAAGSLLYAVYRRSFSTRHRTKRRVRGFGHRLRDLFLPRKRGHAHLPPAASGASSRDKTVWDPLSDQPFQHAGRFEKLRVRVVDAPDHLRAFRAAARARPAWRRSRELLENLHRRPVAFSGLGVGLAARSAPASELLRGVEDLGVRTVLLRLYGWRDDHDEELALARELARRDIELVFAIAQNRELARDPARFGDRVARLARLFAPLGRSFQIGQAINRSKWGIWRPGEYVALFRRAAEALRAARPDVVLLGPAVIDFEPHATAAYLNMRAEGLEFDVLASLLYVDRRGAPEARQLGLDLVGKVALLKALAETSPNCRSGRSWITETNWPLREGPYSPAGRDVAVDEELQASYLARYYLLALGSGLAERVYWWQLAARGYGLVDPGSSRLDAHPRRDGEDAGAASAPIAARRRPAYHALRQLVRRLDGSSCEGPVGAAGEHDRLYRFRTAEGERVLVGWTLEGTSRVELPAEPERVEDRDGRELPVRGRRVDLEEAPRYFFVRE